MKKIAILFYILLHVCHVNAQLGIAHTYSFSTGDTAMWGSTVNLHVFVKNKGTAAFTGNFFVKAQVDTVGGVSCGINTFSSSIVLLPGDSVSATLTFTPNPGVGAFNRVACCGNVIVVWPYASNAVTSDSLRVKLYIDPLSVGMKELHQYMLTLYPNPAKHIINIKVPSHIKFEKMALYDVYAKKIKEAPFSDVIDLSDIAPGVYWIIANTPDGNRYKQRFIKE